MGTNRGRPTTIRSAVRTAVVAALALTAGIVAGTSAVHADDDGPAAGQSWIVTLGDSAISGEAGRWAGNTNDSSWRVDAGGPGAYHDAPGAEQIAGCHRSSAAEAHIGNGVMSLNLACSGARTYTQAGSGDFKPGLDFYTDASGRRSQLVELGEFAATHDVDAVAVLIGANNFGFADIVVQCVTNWLTSPSWWKNYCHDDSSIRNRFTASAVEARTNEVAQAFANVRTAMAGAGYADGDYTIIAQTYSSPIPRGNQIRYAESGWTRQSIGGCGVWNRDANWANDTAVVKMNQAITDGIVRSGVPNYVILDASHALDGRRLCEQGVGLLEEVGVASWQSTGAADRTEWVSQIRTVTTVFGPYQLQEGIHPSWWGQLALRNCLRQAYAGGTPQGGTCVRGANGLNAHGEPNMVLQ